ncbi:hypothetical protein BG004_000728 [Podila humilis]|nr:hypothetical protein BG004_000728 [Podila humilis]
MTRLESMKKKAKIYEMVKKGYDDDPWVEHEDEFGRSRLVRQSEIPKKRQEEKDENEYEHRPLNLGIHDPVNPFPVFMNQQQRSHDGGSRNSHHEGEYIREGGRFYDDTLERRARGAAFYTFSQDATERERQMKELLERRAETERRQEEQNQQKGPRTIHDRFREAKAARWEMIRRKKEAFLIDKEDEEEERE